MSSTQTRVMSRTRWTAIEGTEILVGMNMHARIEDFDEDEQHREVYARIGLAVYAAQVFETSVANLIAVAEAIDGRHRSQVELDNRFDDLFGQMLGRLVTLLESDQRLSDSDLAVCRQAQEQRNRLAHRYWREEMEDMITQTGRQRMVDDLDSARELFRVADGITDAVLFRVAAVHGITADAVEAEAGRRRAQVLAMAEAEPGNTRR
ncbi:MAG: hypothetical protein JWP14_2670 [Frankiales bacterium]|nr:hypothetical protein [Frankiales bacterium]